MAAAAEVITLNDVDRLVSGKYEGGDEEALRRCEEQILACGSSLAKQKNITDLRKLLVMTRPFFAVLGKAKASKLIRALVEFCLQVDNDQASKVALVRECIAWSESNHRVFLRRTLLARLIRLHNDDAKHTDAIKLATELMKELKKLEDRELQMEVSLEEARAAFALNNLARAKTALVAARTTSNSAYVTATMQANIDLMSGILFAADEKDFKTAFSYFYEAAEGFLCAGATETAQAVRAVKYMCLCKIMMNDADAIPVLLSTKALCTVKSEQLEAVKELGKAFNKRSLQMYHQVISKYQSALVEDGVVKAHSTALYEKMLEKEISRVIEPYCVVEISHIVKKVGLPQLRIEKTLATMILDRKFRGCIDQRSHILTVYPPSVADKTFEKGVDLIHALSKAVDASYTRAASIR